MSLPLSFYFNDDGLFVVDASIVSDDPTVVDNVLPAELRQSQISKEKYEAFWGSLFPMWLMDSQYETKAKQATKDNPAHISFADHIDLEHLGVHKNGKVHHETLREIVRIVSRFHRANPQPGIIHNTLAKGHNLQDAERMMEAMEDPTTGQIDKRRLDKRMQGDDVRLAKIMLPPELRDGPPLSPDHISKSSGVWMRWIRSIPRHSPMFKDKLAWKMDLMQLGIMTDKGQLNEKRTQLISDYIWGHRDDKPSFLNLMKWLRDEVDSQKILAEKAKAQKATQARKKAKAARKKAKKARRR